MSMSRSSTMLMAAASCVAIAALAGCSSSGGNANEDTSSTAAGTSAGSSAAGRFASPDITFMNIADTASPTLALPQLPIGAKAAVAEINSTGGINGHRVVLETCNSKSDPNVAATCAREAVSKHVSAVVGAVSLQSDAMNTILAEAGIPSVGNIAIGKLDFTSPISFPFNSVEVNQLGNVMGMPGYKDCKKPAEIVANIPALTLPGKDIEKFFKAAVPGAAPVRSVQVAPASTSVAAPVATALGGGTDCLFLVTDGTTSIAALRAVAASGAKVRTAVTALTPAELTALGPAAEGVYIDSEFLLPGTPGGAEFAERMSAVDPKAPKDARAATAYTGVLVLAAAAKQANLTSFTAKDFLQAMNNAKDITVPTLGTVPGFPADSGVPGLPRINYTFEYTYQWKGGKLNLISDKPVDVRPALRIVHP